jgi:signal transduction histidine kinase/CheY-like chemotaxis protein/HPt (histidine-containing phosphotransfer) domain-containing protein
MQRSAPVDPVSETIPAARWPLWLIAAVALAALATSLSLLLQPALPASLLLAGLAAASAMIAGTALVALVLARHRAEALPFAAPAARNEAAVPAAILRELESLRAMQGELVAAKQEAEAATMAKGEFLATMSHEIRTPLNGIVPLLELMRSTPLRPDQRDYLATAHQSALELLRIVDDILDYSKLEASKVELECVGVNLKHLVDSVATLMEGSATAKGLRLGVVIDPAVRLAVRGDPVRLRQVLTNLVSNAIKFTERGSVTIQISKRGESRGHHEVTFAVRDTGIGLSPETATKLFQPFSQADASTTRVYGGTGLGLVICKRLVDLMQGKIGVRSELGRGSVFWFDVPLQKAIGDLRGRTDLAGVRVVLLSSNDAFLRRTGALVTQIGMNHLLSNLAVDALSKLRAASGKDERWQYEALIVDVASVGAATMALVRNIRRDPSLDNLRILISGNDDNVQDLRGDERLTSISDSFDERELRETLNRLLGVGHAEVKHEFPILASAPDPAFDQATTLPTRKLHGRALLVEDNSVNARVALRLLSLLGIEADMVGDGRAALEKIERTTYDLILMDCQMPVMDGYTATRTRREDERQKGLPRLPIIAMTANAMAGDREKCLDAGMDDYLTKPLDRGLLEATIARWLPDVVDARAKSGTAPGVPPALSAAPEPAAAPKAPPESPIEMPAASSVGATARMPAIDQGIVQELLEVMGDGFAGLVRVYFEDTPKLLERLREAVDMTDHGTIAEITHSLKSSSANLGALPLAELAKRAEIDARAKRSDELGSLPTRAANEYQRVVRAYTGLGLT